MRRPGVVSGEAALRLARERLGDRVARSEGLLARMREAAAAGRAWADPVALARQAEAAAAARRALAAADEARAAGLSLSGQLEAAARAGRR